MKRELFSNGLTAVVASFALAACAGGFDPGVKPDQDDTKGSNGLGKAEAWGPSDAPSLFNANLEYKLDTLPMAGEATAIPWASSYWPVYEDSINYKWDGASSDSAAKKYEKAFSGTGVEDAVSKNHGIDSFTSRKECSAETDCSDLKDGSSCAKRPGAAKGRCIPTWWGICHAWTPASILMPEPKHPVTLGGVTFKVMDIKALVTLAHNSTTTKFVSLRCDKDGSSDTGIHFDEYGSPTAADKECKDTNPATYHVLLANYLGIMKQAFAEDRTYDLQVWNQPLRGYKVTLKQDVTAAEANRLIGVTSVGGTTVHKTGTVAKTIWTQLDGFTVVAGSAAKVHMTGTGDADLYVAFGAAPTAAAYACRPYAGTSNEDCDLTVPAGQTKMFVGVLGYADTSTYDVAITTGGTTPSMYAFNTAATRFVHMNSEVKYIGESSASAADDGNLASRIDNYTHTDSYDYILELDAAGKIIGGEWVGNSKKAHPDFVWLPMSHSGETVAGGKIAWAKVKQLLDLSVASETPTTPTTPTGDLNPAGAVAKGEFKQFGPFAVAAGGSITVDMTGDGDADLYVRKAAAPTLTAYDCRPYKNGSAESCTVTASVASSIYVAVSGYAATSNYALAIKVAAGTTTPPTTTPPTTTPAFVHLNVTGSVAAGGNKVFTLDIPAGKKVVIRTTAPNDVDLYIQMNAAPTTSAYLARGWTTSGNETITYTATETGKLYIMVDGYAESSFALKTSDN